MQKSNTKRQKDKPKVKSRDTPSGLFASKRTKTFLHFYLSFWFLIFDFLGIATPSSALGGLRLAMTEKLPETLLIYLS